MCSLQCANAYDFCIDNICYNILSRQDLTCEVTSNPDIYKGDIIIPSYVTRGLDTYKVIAIGDHAFNERSYNRGWLETISLPNTIERIGKSAFYCCGLYTIDIPNSVKIIDDNAFAECLCLLSIEIPNSVVKIGAWSFHNCWSLKNVTLLSGNEPLDIEFRAFSGSGNDLNLFIGRSINEEDEGILGVSPIRIDIEEEIDLGRFCESPRIKDKLRMLNIGKNISGFPCNLTDFSELVILRVQDVTPPECPIFTDDQYSSIKLIVPDGTVNNYKNSKGWGNFNDIVEYSCSNLHEIFFVGSMNNWKPTYEWKFTVYNKEATIYNFNTAVPQNIYGSDEFKIAFEDWSSIDYGLESGDQIITIDTYTKLDTTGISWPCQLNEERWFGTCWLNIDSAVIIFTKSNDIPDFSSDGVKETFEEKYLQEKTYYNLQGIKINHETPSNGLYIIKENNKVKKVHKH